MIDDVVSPELVLVDPDLAARARAAMPLPSPAAAPPLAPPVPRAAAAPSAPPGSAANPYPAWARVTAALWLVVLGILIGGAAIPHAQDTPHLLPKGSEPQVCTQNSKPPRVAPLPPQSGVLTQPGR